MRAVLAAWDEHVADPHLPRRHHAACRESRPLTCAPTATRTRDLLLRRHFRNVAWRCHMWPDVLFRYRENGWMWPVAALSL
jgi:hypothetical protein